MGGNRQNDLHVSWFNWSPPPFQKYIAEKTHNTPVAPTNNANVTNIAIKGRYTSNHNKCRNLGWTYVTPPPDVTTFRTSQTLRTTDVTMCHKKFWSPIFRAQLSVSLSLLFRRIKNFLYHCPRVWLKQDVFGKSYLLIGEQQTTPKAQILIFSSIM